jgi:two-component system sensor histidine kinase KdpD
MAAGILTASQSLDRLVDGVMRVARLDAGDEPILEDVAPADIVAEALGVAEAGARARVIFDPRIVRFPADPARLARALANLVDNALKFGPAGGLVEVQVAPCVLGRAGGVVAGVAFAVLDRGRESPGRERAFAAFERGGDLPTGEALRRRFGTLRSARHRSTARGRSSTFLARAAGEFRIFPAQGASDRSRTRRA